MEELRIIQEKLNAPKTLRNSFWNYNYRSAETILEAVKPLLKETETILLLSDEIVREDTRFYIKATAVLINKDWKQITVTWYAREEETKKGMDGSQITGASSSYARKYALNWLFAIDDEKDSDATNTHEKAKQQYAPKEPVKTKDKFWDANYRGFIDNKDKFKTYEEAIEKIESVYDIDNHYKEQIKLLYTNF